MAATADIGTGTTADQAVPLDALLVDATFEPLRRYRLDLSTARFLAGLTRRPAITDRRMAGLVQELGRAAAVPRP